MKRKVLISSDNHEADEFTERINRRILIPKDTNEIEKSFADELKELHLSMMTNRPRERGNSVYDSFPDDVKETIELAQIITETAYMSMFAVHPVMENLIFAHSKTGKVRISVEEWIEIQRRRIKHKLVVFYHEGVWSGDREELFHEGLYLEEEYEEGD
tara:strand:+ start:122 stop:595 length:474 start_codon:yes stop_codon:yes gene_type:complete